MSRSASNTETPSQNPFSASQGDTAAVTPVLVAQTGDVRRFARLLRGIGFHNRAVMTITEAGFEVTTALENKTMSAIAWIPSNLFDEFEYTPPKDADEEDATCLEISLDALLQCLNIFGNAGGNIPNDVVIGGGGGGFSKKKWAGDAEGGDGFGFGGAGGGGAVGGKRKDGRKTAMRMSWLGAGHPLQVLLRDDDPKGPTTTCNLKVFTPEEIVSEAFDQENAALYLIMKSERFREALLDLPHSCDRITLLCCGANPNAAVNDTNGDRSSNSRKGGRNKSGSFTIRAAGDFGETELDYPNDKDVMEKFICQEGVSFEFSYHANLFSLLTRALHQSKQICLQIEQEGFLSLQILMPTPEGMKVGDHAGILEFKMQALVEEEDD